MLSFKYFGCNIGIIKSERIEQMEEERQQDERNFVSNVEPEVGKVNIEKSTLTEEAMAMNNDRNEVGSDLSLSTLSEGNDEDNVDTSEVGSDLFTQLEGNNEDNEEKQETKRIEQ